MTVRKLDNYWKNQTNRKIKLKIKNEMNAVWRKEQNT